MSDIFGTLSPPMSREDLILALETLSLDSKRVFSVVEVCIIAGVPEGRLNHWQKCGMIRPTFTGTKKDKTAEGSLTRQLYDFDALVKVLMFASLYLISPEFVNKLSQVLQKDPDRTGDGAEIERWLKTEFANAAKEIYADMFPSS